MKNQNNKVQTGLIVLSIMFSATFIHGAAASDAYPLYKLAPAAPSISDSVVFFIAKGLYYNACVPTYLTSFTVTRENVICKSTTGPCLDLYRISIEYDSAGRWLDSLVNPKNNSLAAAPQAIWRYIYNNDTVFYFISQCCDRFNYLYSKNGVLLCAPDGGMSGHGDGKCPDFSQNATNGQLVWKNRLITSQNADTVCGQTLTEYGPQFCFGKLQAGNYSVYDAKVSSSPIKHFSVSETPTLIMRQEEIGSTNHGPSGFSMGFHAGSFTFSLEKAQRISITAFRLDGQRIAGLGGQLFSAGPHRIYFEKQTVCGLVAILRVDGEGWSKTMPIHLIY